MIFDFRFLDVITEGVYAIINWLGVIIGSLLNFPPIFIILFVFLPLSISVIFVVIKIIRQFIWGV